MDVYELSSDSTCVMQSSQRSTLPGLQDLKGQWSGGVQAYGGGGGATNVDFNVRGQSWQWGDYALDQARLLHFLRTFLYDLHIHADL